MADEAPAAAPAEAALGEREEGVEATAEDAGAEEERRAELELQAAAAAIVAEKRRAELEQQADAANKKITLRKKDGDRRAQADLYLELVSLYHRLESHPLELASTSSALELLRDLGDTDRKFQLLHSVVGLDVHKEQPEEALQAASRAAVHFRTMADREGEAWGQLGAASVHSARHEGAKAVAAITLALDLFIKANSKQGECLAFQVASKAHVLCGNAREAVRLGEKGRALAQSVLQGKPEVEAGALLALAEALIAKADETNKEEGYHKACQVARLASQKYGDLGDVQSQQVAQFLCTRAENGEREMQAKQAGEPGTVQAARYAAIQKLGCSALEGPRSMMFQVNGGRLI